MSEIKRTVGLKGLQRTRIRSSETSRKTPKLQFDFKPFSANDSTHKNTTDRAPKGQPEPAEGIEKQRLVTNQKLVTNEREFLEWFIGFFEAEGSFIFWTEKKKTRFRIEVSQQDKDLLYFIKKQFGFGKVVAIKPKTGNPYWRYGIEDLSSLLQMIALLNGNLILQKKRVGFKKWLFEFNKRYTTHIVFKEEIPQITLTDGWLSGFLEGDGGFYIPQNFIRPTKKGEAYNLKLRFFVTQKDGSDLISQLRSLLKVTTPVRDQINTVISPITKLEEKRLYNRIDTATLESATILLEYLTRFPFLGVRQITIDSWKKLMKYRRTTYPVTAETTATIQNLVDQTKKVGSLLQPNRPDPPRTAAVLDIESSALQEPESKLEDVKKFE